MSDLPGAPGSQERWNAIMDEQTDLILDHGWTAIAVFPTEDSAGNYHFCYTVGRSLVGKPELIVTGMSQNAGPLLDGLIDQRGDLLDAQSPGVPFHLSEEHTDEWMVLAPVPDEERRKHLTMTAAQCGPDFTALQVLWTDDEDRWPWEPGHARMQRMAEEGDTMPVLAGDDWRPD